MHHRPVFPRASSRSRMRTSLSPVSFEGLRPGTLQSSFDFSSDSGAVDRLGAAGDASGAPSAGRDGANGGSGWGGKYCRGGCGGSTDQGSAPVKRVNISTSNTLKSNMNVAHGRLRTIGTSPEYLASLKMQTSSYSRSCVLQACKKYTV